MKIPGMYLTVMVIALNAALGAQQAPAQGSGGKVRLIAEARFETRSSFVTLGGRLAPLRHIDQTAGVAGIVSAIHAYPGTWVKEGEPILSITRDVPGESYQPVVIRARIGGRISDIKPAAGSEVGSGTVVASLIDDSRLTLEAFVSDRDAYRIRAFMPREISARSADGASLKGSLTGISLEPDYSTGLFTARFLFSANPEARVGMVLYIDLPVSQVRGVFLDRSLVQRRLGRSLLWVMGKDDKLLLIEIKTGALFDQQICVSSGIEAGDLVLLRLTGKETEGMTRADWETAAKALPPASPGQAGPGFQFGGH